MFHKSLHWKPGPDMGWMLFSSLLSNNSTTLQGCSISHQATTTFFGSPPLSGFRCTNCKTELLVQSWSYVSSAFPTYLAAGVRPGSEDVESKAPRSRPGWLPITRRSLSRVCADCLHISQGIERSFRSWILVDAHEQVQMDPRLAQLRKRGTILTAAALASTSIRPPCLLEAHPFDATADAAV